MTEKPRFEDNQDGTITDTQTDLVWSKEDTWLTDGKWVTWDEAMDFIIHQKNIRLGGLVDWRLPTLKEAQELYDSGGTNTDKYGKTIHLDPIFTQGPLARIWVDELGGGNDSPTLNFETGEVKPLFKSKCPRMSARAVCESS